MVVSGFPPKNVLHAHLLRWAETPVGRDRERDGGAGEEGDGRETGGSVSSNNRQTTAKE